MWIGSGIGPCTKVHIPEISSWKGLLQMICLGNLVVLLPSLDYRTYWDLRPILGDQLTGPQIAEEIQRRPRVQSQMRLAYQTFSDFRYWFTTQYIVTEDGKPVDVQTDIFEVRSNCNAFHLYPT